MKQSNWWKSAVAYQIYPKSFMDSSGDGVGDICGITSKLDYLERLGIDVLWISPIYKSPGYDNGYDVSDYCAIDPVFGTMDDFNHLLKEAHRRKLKVIMDLVVNHTSDEHPWFIASKSSKDNEKSDWYIWRDKPNNWTDFFSGNSAWTYCAERGQYYLHMFSEKQPDLNWDCDELRQAVYDMMRFWLDIGVDGFRMDVISYISKPEDLPDGDMGKLCANGPHVHEYLREMRREVLSDFDIMTVGEAAGVTVDEALKYASNDGAELNMVFHFEINDLDGGESCKWVLRKTNINKMQALHTKWQNALHGKAWNSLYLSNHDQPRAVPRYGDEGKLRERSAKALAMCIYFMEGTPFIYQGEELGMTACDFRSVKELRDIESINAYNNLIKTYSAKESIEIISRRGRDSARTPMQWDNIANAGFTSGMPWIGINPNYEEINTAEQETRTDSVLNFYRKLIKLRKSLDLGEYKPIKTEHESLFCYKRGNVLVAANLSAETVSIAFEVRKALLYNVDEPGTHINTLQPFEAIIAETRTIIKGAEAYAES